MATRTNNEEDKKYIRKAELQKKEGWSPAAVKRLLGEPDKVTEPKVEGKKPQLRFLLERVTEIEQSGKLTAFNEKRAARLAAKEGAAPAN